MMNSTHGGSPIQPRTCHRGTPWCTQHTTDGDEWLSIDMCASAAIDVGAGCAVWLTQEVTGIEPNIVVDVPTTGADLSIAQAGELRDALWELRQVVIEGRAIHPGFLGEPPMLRIVDDEDDEDDES